ncbi:MAG: hypothetical protein A2Y22_07235 [Clostridiales bacterium GWD2_32_59]|nr:MAG: hypothetical protein A2Y22_07235 [Clostridiales bacterium GWD2_32_59]
MILSINSELNVFLLVLCVGFFLGIIYDLIRIVRRVYKHNIFAINIEDSIFWIVTIFILFEFLKYKNSGEFRGFILIGCIIGVILYFYLLSNVLSKMGVAFLKYIDCLIQKVFKLLNFINFFSKIPLLSEKIRVLYNKKIMK